MGNSGQCILFWLITILSPSPFIMVFLRGRVRGQTENERFFTFPTAAQRQTEKFSFCV
jgi:hypothetical protein